MAGGRYEERVRDLLADAGSAADQGDWVAVRDLAGAALALAPGNAAAEELLQRADDTDPTSGERRQLTVMFCDVVGSTALSQDHDPELVREVLRSYQVTCDRVVRRYEGRIARFIGDGVLAYFGHPVAHEDDARRGVKAGLDLIEALRPVTDEVRERHGVDLRIRVAVHTGLVVRADMGTSTTPDRDAIVGDTPNIAARLQDHAEPGTLLISQDTYELVRPWFLVVPQGAVVLKGIDEPMRAYRVVDEGPEDDRVHAQADLTPFVGRGEELQILLDAWDQVRSGAFRAVALSGHPGVGKSRLADVLRRRVEADDATARLIPCSAFHGSTALHPVRRLLERVAGIEPHQGPDIALPKLWSAMEAVGQTDALPLVASLLELPPTSWCPAPQMEGPKLREELLATLLAWIRAVADRGPVLLIVDDLQWADPTTLELLGRVVATSVPGLLLVATIRDDAKVPWPSATTIELDRLSVEDLTDLARRTPEGRRLDEGHLGQLIERSDGIPLYLEELLRTAQVANAGAAPDSHIPAALRDLLLARFAGPGVDLRLAQVLATIGSEAPLPLVAVVTRLDSGLLAQQLAALVDAGIVAVIPGEPTSYRFHHHLLAELAYDTQLQGNRRQCHGVVADALMTGPSDIPRAAPTVLAHHLERAGRPAEAVRFLTAAAEAAHGLGANAEVGELLTHAMSLLDLVEGDERAQLEFDVRLVRGTNAASILGFAAPQAIEDFTACQGLVALQVGSGGFLDDADAVGGNERMWSTTALWANLLLQGRLADADALNRDLVGQLRPGGDLRPYFATGPCYIDFFRGNYEEALRGLEDAERLMPDATLPVRLTVPSDPRATNSAHLAYVLGVRCRFEEARRQSDHGIAFARGQAFPVGPFSVCYVLSMRASLEVMAGDLDAAAAHTDQLLQVADRHGFTFWTIVGGFYEAYTQLRKGIEGADQRCQMSLMLMQSVGVLVWAPYFNASVAAALLEGGRPEDALGMLATGAAIAADTTAHYWSAELARLEGVARLATGDPGGADRRRDAVRLAAERGALLHELWARTALMEHVGGDAERAALAEVLERVGEGAPPADVATARALLV
jgi:class 3 adenylate cyclase/tetratricopeptide (TPR) repeat protein